MYEEEDSDDLFVKNSRDIIVIIPLISSLLSILCDWREILKDAGTKLSHLGGFVVVVEHKVFFVNGKTYFCRAPNLSFVERKMFL